MSRAHVQQELLKASSYLGVDYEVQDVVGEGTYSVVYSALHKPSGQKVAIKKLSPSNHSTSFLRTLREIKLLRLFRHDNIVSLLGIHKPRSYEDFQDRPKSYPTTTASISSTRPCAVSKLSTPPASCTATSSLHIYFNAKYDLKICDFGLARSAASIEKDRGLATENVGTRWYRAPEVMLTSKHYTKAIDVWSVGCILAEMLGGNPLFPGDDYNHQLTLIFDVLGTPNAEDYYAIVSRNARKYIRGQPLKVKTHWKEIFPEASDLALDLLERLLTFNPTKRITAAEAVKHPYFKQYHDPEDEPTAAPIPEQLFDFDKPSDCLSEEQLKRLVYEEVMRC